MDSSSSFGAIPPSPLLTPPPQKHTCLIVAGIATGSIMLFIGLCIALVLLVVAKPDKVAKDFIINIEDNNLTKAYALTSESFQRTTSEAAFNEAIYQITETNPIIAFSIHESNVQDTIATIQGIITTETGTRSATIQLIQEENTWKIRTFNTGKLIKNAP